MSRPCFIRGPLSPWFERSLDKDGWARLRALHERGFLVTGDASSSRGPFRARTVIDPDGRGPLTVEGISSVSAGEALARLEGKAAA